MATIPNACLLSSYHHHHPPLHHPLPTSNLRYNHKYPPDAMPPTWTSPPESHFYGTLVRDSPPQPQPHQPTPPAAPRSTFVFAAERVRPVLPDSSPFTYEPRVFPRSAVKTEPLDDLDRQAFEQTRLYASESLAASEAPPLSHYFSPSGKVDSVPQVISLMSAEDDEDIDDSPSYHPQDAIDVPTAMPDELAQQMFASLGVPVEVPFRATHASPRMRRMMSVFRLDPFAAPYGTFARPGEDDDVGKPLDHPPVMVEWRIDGWVDAVCVGSDEPGGVYEYVLEEDPEVGPNAREPEIAVGEVITKVFECPPTRKKPSKADGRIDKRRHAGRNKRPLGLGLDLERTSPRHSSMVHVEESISASASNGEDGEALYRMDTEPDAAVELSPSNDSDSQLATIEAAISDHSVHNTPTIYVSPTEQVKSRSLWPEPPISPASSISSSSQPSPVTPTTNIAYMLPTPIKLDPYMSWGAHAAALTARPRYSLPYAALPIRPSDTSGRYQMGPTPSAPAYPTSQQFMSPDFQQSSTVQGYSFPYAPPFPQSVPTAQFSEIETVASAPPFEGYSFPPSTSQPAPETRPSESFAVPNGQYQQQMFYPTAPGMSSPFAGAQQNVNIHRRWSMPVNSMTGTSGIFLPVGGRPSHPQFGYSGAM